MAWGLNSNAPCVTVQTPEYAILGSPRSERRAMARTSEKAMEKSKSGVRYRAEGGKPRVNRAGLAALAPKTHISRRAC
jgi:hypothetical protein